MSMTAILILVAGGLLLCLIFSVVVRIFDGSSSGSLFPSVAMMIAACGLVLILLTNPRFLFDLGNNVVNWLLGPEAVKTEGDKPTPKETPQPSTSHPPEPSPSPKAEPSEPIHIDWNLILIIAASAIALVIVIATCYFLYNRWKAGESSRKAKAERVAAIKAAREENKKIWSSILDEGDSLVKKWAELSTDVESILKFPIYARVDNPLTNKVIRAVTSVRVERRDNLLDLDKDPWTTTYGVAVKELRDDLRVLESSAQFYHLNSFSTSELKLLDQAQNLLNTARNTASAPNERQMAYARLEKIFTDLNLSLPEETKEVFELEATTVKQLTTGKV